MLTILVCFAGSPIRRVPIKKFQDFVFICPDWLCWRQSLALSMSQKSAVMGAVCEYELQFGTGSMKQKNISKKQAAAVGTVC